jgi:hypothetical protein
MIIQERPLAKTAVPAYRQMVDELDFTWVEDHLKRQKIKSEIQEIKAELQKLNKMLPGNEDLRKNAHAGLKELEAESIKLLAGYLNESRRGQNPFYNVQRMKDLLASFAITTEMIDAAVDLLPEPKNSISLEEKQKQRAKLEKALEKKKAELEKASPPEHFQWINGKPVSDLCEAFEKKWRSTQARFNGPCSILGHQLDGCGEPEQQAWRDLGIRSAMNATGRVSPIPKN